jgi:hypothetical protein
MASELLVSIAGGTLCERDQGRLLDVPRQRGDPGPDRSSNLEWSLRIDRAIDTSWSHLIVARRLISRHPLSMQNHPASEP